MTIPTPPKPKPYKASPLGISSHALPDRHSPLFNVGSPHRFTESTYRRRASVIAINGRPLVLDFRPIKSLGLAQEDYISEPGLGARHQYSPDAALLHEEADLLRDNDILPDNVSGVAAAWEEAIAHGKVTDSTYKREFLYLTKSSLPLIVAFVFQNSLSLASIFSVGHIGSKELAAVSFGAMSANITGYTLIQGLATCLDTLCPQAYGARKYHLVGVFFQRCTALIFTCILPVVVVWMFYAQPILVWLMPDSPESAILAALYLRVVTIGIPGYILFETGKKFLQAQGIFHASTYILLVCAPLNALLNYVLVWSPYVGIGYLGAPLAVSISYWAMALMLFGYTVYVGRGLPIDDPANPLKCWNGFCFSDAFRNWGNLTRLAFPGVVMITAEFLAFECLTLLASRLGTVALAAQSVGVSMAEITYQVPFALGIASSTRIANFLGSGLPRAAKKSTLVALLMGGVVSLFNLTAVIVLRSSIPRWFTSDEAVIAEIDRILPIIAAIQIADTMNANSAGCLRGQGQQKIGGIVNIISYYFIGIPVSYTLTFHYDMGLFGLWVGSGLAMFIIGIVQSYYAMRVDWDQMVLEARIRNNSEDETSPLL